MTSEHTAHTPLRSRVIGLGLTLLMLTAAQVSAPRVCSAQQTPSDKKAAAAKAKEHFARGASHFYKEQYDQAVVEFLNAYDYYPDPMILYNLARAHAHLDNIKAAIQTAEKAQRSGGMPAKATTRNAARIAAWRRLLASRNAAEAIAGPQAKPPEPVDPAPATTGLSATGWTGVGLTALGAGLVSYATYVEFDIKPQIANYKTAAGAGDEDSYARFKRDIEDRQQVGQITLYSGIACLAAGIGLWSYDLIERPPSEPTVSVGVSPGGDGPSVGISFRFE